MISIFFNEICEIFNKINIFEKSITQKDCHSNDYFTNNNFCEIYQTDFIFNELQNSWDCSKYDINEYFKKTNHICLTQKIYSEYLKLKSENFFSNKNMRYEMSTSVIFSGLNILTISNPHLFEFNRKIQSIFSFCDKKEIENLISNDEIQRNLKRIKSFYLGIDKNILSYKNDSIKLKSEITTMENRFSLNPQKKFEKTKIKSEDFLLLIPPCEKMRILMTNDLQYLLNWCIYHDSIILTKYLKRFTIDTFSEFLNEEYPYLQIQYDDIIDVVDRRNLNKNSARMIIFNSLE